MSTLLLLCSQAYLVGACTQLAMEEYLLSGIEPCPTRSPRIPPSIQPRTVTVANREPALSKPWTCTNNSPPEADGFKAVTLTLNWTFPALSGDPTISDCTSSN